MSEVKKKIAESSSYNLLTVYFNFILGILNTFIIARVLKPEEWALIILTLLFINIVVFFCNLFPPNAQDSIKYYIPTLTSEGNDKIELKRRFIFHVYKIRIGATIILFIIFLILMTVFKFQDNLYEIILIMAPMMIFIILINLNTSILLAFQKFKLVFFINIINYLIVTIWNSSIFFFELKNPLFLIAFAYLFGTIISGTSSVALLIILFPAKMREKSLNSGYNSNFYKIHKSYGLNLILADVFALLTGLIINLLFLTTGNIKYITYLTICQISATAALLFSSSNPHSYISIFSEINYEKNPKEFIKNFNTLSIFLMLFNSIVIAVLQFYIVIYVAVIYSEYYYVILTAIQIFLFTAFAKMAINNFLILTQSTNNTKINAEISFFEMIINILITIIALLFFDFYILIIFYLISSFILTFIMFYLIKKKTDLELKLIIIFKPFLAFIIGFFIIYIISPLLYFEIFNKAYLNFIISGTIKMALFLTIIYIIIYSTKLITKEEFKKFIEIIPILNLNNILIKKIVKFIEKTLPSKKTELFKEN